MNDIVRELKLNGFVVMNNWFSLEDIEILRSEYEKVINNTELRDEYSVGLAGKCFGDNILKNASISLSKLYDKNLKNIASKFFGDKLHQLDEIFFVKDIVGSKHIANDLHFDIKQTLKFFVYLDDVTERSGALICVPKSHKWTKELRKDPNADISYANREISRDLPEVGAEVSVEGKAGTLVIFDTDIFHKAGTVHEGERRVIRAHCRRKNRVSFFKRLRRKLTSFIP